MVRFLVEGGLVDPDRTTGASIEGAAERGDLELVRQLVLNNVATGDNAQSTYARAVKSASMNGHIPVVRLRLTRMEELGLTNGLSAAMFGAAVGGCLKVAEWLFEQSGSDESVDLFQDQPDNPRNSVDFFPCTILDAAAQNGHLEVLEFLDRIDRLVRRKRKDRDGEPQRREGLHCTTMAMDAAAEDDHINVVQWLHENRTEGCTTKAMDRAAAQGHLEIVKWLHENRKEGCTTSAMDCAAFMQFQDRSTHYTTPTCCAGKEPDSFPENQLAVLEYLRANRSEGCTTAALNGAAALGNLKIVQWLHENTTATCTKKAMDDAAGLGRLDLVKYLHENRTEGCTAHAMDSAAAYGHLEVVQWLHANRPEGCLATALDAAAGSSHCSVVRHDNHLRVVQWLLAQSSSEVHLISAMGGLLLP